MRNDSKPVSRGMDARKRGRQQVQSGGGDPEGGGGWGGGRSCGGALVDVAQEASRSEKIRSSEERIAAENIASVWRLDAVKEEQHVHETRKKKRLGGGPDHFLRENGGPQTQPRAWAERSRRKKMAGGEVGTRYHDTQL